MRRPSSGSRRNGNVPDHNIPTGLQSILDNTVSDPKSKSIIDGIFGTVNPALKMAQSKNCS
jgi:hypothetical protein